jgi:hypothetical protein
MKKVAMFIIILLTGIPLSWWSSQHAQPSTPEALEYKELFNSSESFTPEEFTKLKESSDRMKESLKESNYASKAFGGMVFKKVLVVPALVLAFFLFGRRSLIFNFQAGLYAAVVLVAFFFVSSIIEALIYCAAIGAGLAFSSKASSQSGQT